MKDLINGELREIDQQQMTEHRRKEASGEMEPEPMLIAEKSRFVLFPIKHTDVSLYFRILVGLLHQTHNLDISKNCNFKVNYLRPRSTARLPSR
jgi:hypothetical protein